MVYKTRLLTTLATEFRLRPLPGPQPPHQDRINDPGSQGFGDRFGVGTLTSREAQLTRALEQIEALLKDWPTMRALSASGAEKATENKLAARSICAGALRGEGRGSQ